MTPLMTWIKKKSPLSWRTLKSVYNNIQLNNGLIFTCKCCSSYCKNIHNFPWFSWKRLSSRHTSCNLFKKHLTFLYCIVIATKIYMTTATPSFKIHLLFYLSSQAHVCFRYQSVFLPWESRLPDSIFLLFLLAAFPETAQWWRQQVETSQTFIKPM